MYLSITYPFHIPVLVESFQPDQNNAIRKQPPEGLQFSYYRSKDECTREKNIVKEKLLHFILMNFCLYQLLQNHKNIF